MNPIGRNTATSTAVVAITAKPTLARAATRRDQPRLAHVDAAPAVFEHDDRIVDDETDRQHEREQSQKIDRETERIRKRRRTR